MNDPKSSAIDLDAPGADLSGAGQPWYELRVQRVIRETPDASSIVLEVPAHLAERFRYRAGQYLTFKLAYEGHELRRCYSLASSPDSEAEHKVTVKRVVAGRASNWINDHLRAGSTVHVLPPAGRFTLNEGKNRLALFAGGSGITPIVSLIKTALATTQRPLHLVYANRDRQSVIFAAELDALAARAGGRLEVSHHLDVDQGFVDTRAVTEIAQRWLDAEVYLCGPQPFMDVVETALRSVDFDAARIHIERFVSLSDEIAEVSPLVGDQHARLSVYLDGRVREVPHRAGQTVLAAVQAAGLEPPFSCTEGFCGCCMAKLSDGRVRMIKNDFLSERELSEGWVLTCQSVPLTTTCRVDYPD